ncbi:M23 family metallopeptidase [Winogradskyella maritima]|uniref:M23 family metallopeptidase n=1 Tax=Winogradskyella maritima TaxID=1517766 RepID=A0ABV8AI64_9FLAO|nr:M23 family metallopeptidase [Winogradskyella maritima]
MKHLLLLILFPLFAFGQNPYPQDYFQNPLDIPLVLGGSFAELRSNHFHSGLDIKTQRKEGLNVLAAAEGYVSRIKVAHFGYGKALYITHPNGYTTVYAHLKKFSPKIEAYIKQCQYEKESFEVEMFPAVDEMTVTKGEIVAFSGNTGSSGGPHLHYEIRDNAERPINPMLFGIDIKDTKAPTLRSVYAYPKDKNSFINGENKRVKLRLIPKTNGDFDIEKVTAIGDIGFGIEAIDQMDLAPNKNGLDNIQTFFNGNKKLEVSFKRFSFDETKHLNRFIDFEYYKTKKQRIQKLFVESNNPLSLFKDVKDEGFIKVEDSTASVFKIEMKDFQNNTRTISIPIEGVLQDSIPSDSTDYSKLTHLPETETTTFEGNKASATFYQNTFYEDQFLDFQYSGDTLKLHEDKVPLLKNFVLNYDISKYRGEDKNRLFIAKLYGYYKRPSYVGTVRKGDTLTARTKNLGWFTLATDTIAPTIKPVNFQDKKWLSKYRYLKVKIDDDLAGISNFRATVNGKWILMEYDYKTNLLVHDFNDGVVTETENNLKIIVTDNVGNSSTFEATFFRK